ncbi:MAG TPA: 16S rRNA (uracil(1498)-N(3))-methyltransferase [Thermoanaerobaculia bacterium]
MNLILLQDGDFLDDEHVRLTGRKGEHIRVVHRPAEGDELTVGRIDGKLGRGRVLKVTAEAVDLRVVLDRDPPPPLPLTLVLALPRPKVLNRVVAAVTSMGVKRIFLMNAWRVEKSYWSSPRLSDENLLHQRLLGLEQGAVDTLLPQIETRRLFRPFVEGELAGISEGTMRLLAHPVADHECPRGLRESVTLVIGPEGGFIEPEVASLRQQGFEPVSIGQRVLRVETAVAALIGRLF